MATSSKTQGGYLKLICGPMYSGKTTHLTSELTTAADTGMSVLYVNHQDDMRSSTGETNGDEHHSTHRSGSTGLSFKLAKVRSSSLSKVEVENYDVIGVDECQFYDDLLTHVSDWVNQKGKIVYCAGLDADAFMKPFGQTIQLVPLANEVTKLSARCRLCIEEHQNHKLKGDIINLRASFSARLVSGKEQKLVGSTGKYDAMCRSHFLQNLEKDK